jgi:hypothetical protein
MGDPMPELELPPLDIGMMFSYTGWFIRDIGLGIALLWGVGTLIIQLIAIIFRKRPRVNPEFLEKGLLGLIIGGLGCLSPIDPGLFFPRITAWILLGLSLFVWGAVIGIRKSKSTRLRRSSVSSRAASKRPSSFPDMPTHQSERSTSKTSESAISKRKAASSATGREMPYRIRDDFLSPAEFSFYRVLRETAGTSLTICPKVRLADLFFVAKPHINRTYFNRIAQKHLDFLICDAKTMEPLLGIELDDASHQRPDRQKRDDFVDAVFLTAGLPLLRVPTQHGYNPAGLARTLRGYLSSHDFDDVSTKSTSEPVGPPLCSKCDLPMVIKTATRGKHKGKQFYACPNFPQCRELKPIN